MGGENDGKRKELVLVIVPCYNEEAIPYFYVEMCRVENEISQFEFENIFVNDGSKDETEEVIQ